MTYAFSAKPSSKDEETNIDGPGFDGDVIGGGGSGGEGEEEQRPLVTFQLSGGSAMPYVPFKFSIVASAEGTYQGTLSAKFDDGSLCGWSYRKRGTWSGGRLEHTLGVESVRKDASSVNFSWKVEDKEYSYAVGYSTGSMSVFIGSDKVTPKKGADFSVTYSGGPSCYAKSLSSLSASLTLEKRKDGNWMPAGDASISLVSFSGGVQSGRLRISSGFEGDRLRLTVSYAGGTSSAEVAVMTSDKIELSVPSTLHVYGVAKTMTIKEL